MAAIKRFFQKRKLDIKFKTAGEGHTLTEDTRQRPSSSARVQSSQPRHGASSSDSQRAAAEAALARMEASKAGSSVVVSSIKAQAKRELEAERKAQAKAQADAAMYAPPTEVYTEANALTSVEGVYFRCPMVSGKVAPKAEIEKDIEDFLYTQLPEEPEMTSALMIHTLNKDPDKVKACTDILCKYIDNIVGHPGEEKYCKVRVNNKVFQEKVGPLQGTQEFMQAAGFERKMMPGPNEVEEEYLVMGSEHAQDADRLKSLKEILFVAEPIKAELDRNLKVYHPSSNAHRMEVPESFYSIKPEELKKEQQRRQEAVEKLGMLRTKEMREREHQRELRKYRYTLIRVRFPDGILLQGTFRALEKLSVLIEFVRENLENSWMPFTLSTQTGHKLEGEETSLAELGLAPAAIVNFALDPTLQREIAAQTGSTQQNAYLKEDVRAWIQSL